MLFISEQALVKLSEPELYGKIRAGIPEWFATNALQSLFVDFARTHPSIKLELTVGDSAMLRRKIAENEIDLALAIRDPDANPPPRVWQEPLYWVSGQAYFERDVVPLALFDAPCPYRALATGSLMSIGKRWEEVFTSNSVAAVRVALWAGSCVSVLPAGAITPESNLKILNAEHGYPDLPPTELAIYAADAPENDAIKSLRQYLTDHVAARLLVV